MFTSSTSSTSLQHRNPTQPPRNPRSRCPVSHSNVFGAKPLKRKVCERAEFVASRLQNSWPLAWHLHNSWPLQWEGTPLRGAAEDTRQRRTGDSKCLAAVPGQRLTPARHNKSSRHGPSLDAASCGFAVAGLKLLINNSCVRRGPLPFTVQSEFSLSMYHPLRS